MNSIDCPSMMTYFVQALRFMVLSSVLPFLVASPALAQSGSGLENPITFLGSYRQRIGPLREAYANASIDGLHQSFSSTQPQTESAAEQQKSANGTNFFYEYSHGNERLRLKRDRPRYFDRVFIQTESHQWRVSRRNPEDAYILEASDTSRVPSHEVRKIRNRVKNGAYCVAGFPDFPEYVASPEFTIQGVTQEVLGEESLLRFNFRYLPVGKKKPRIEGWIRLSLSLGWVIRDYDIEVQTVAPDNKTMLSHIIGTIMYKTMGTTPIPVQIIQSDTLNKNQTVEDKYFISRFSFDEIPSSDFTLASFDLGDFDESPSRRSSSRFFIYAMGVAILAAVISIVLSRAAASLRKGKT